MCLVLFLPVFPSVKLSPADLLAFLGNYLVPRSCGVCLVKYSMVALLIEQLLPGGSVNMDLQKPCGLVLHFNKVDLMFLSDFLLLSQLLPLPPKTKLCKGRGVVHRTVLVEFAGLPGEVPRYWD